MYVDRIREVFERYNYQGSSQMNQQNFYSFLSQLTPSHSYEREVADELWQQAARGSSTIQVNSLCQTINDGINILQQKLDEINNEIKQLEKEKVQAYNSANGANRGVIAKIQNDILNLHQDREEFEEDLRLVTLPFEINLMGRNSQFVRYDSRPGLGLNESLMSNRSGRGVVNEELTYLLWLSIIFGTCEVILIYQKYDFLNLIVLVSLSSIYLLNHFDNLYIKLTLGLTCVSEVLDIIWLFMYAGQYWNPPPVGNNPAFMLEYLRIIIVLAIIVIVVKVPIGYYLYKIKNLNENSYKIDTGVFKIILEANKNSNPVTRQLTSTLSNP